MKWKWSKQNKNNIWIAPGLAVMRCYYNSSSAALDREYTRAWNQLFTHFHHQSSPDVQSSSVEMENQKTTRTSIWRREVRWNRETTVSCSLNKTTVKEGIKKEPSRSWRTSSIVFVRSDGIKFQMLMDCKLRAVVSYDKIKAKEKKRKN